MLKPMKKIDPSSKKEREQEEFENQDKFLEKSFEAEHFIERNKEGFKRYGTYVAVVLALVVSYILYDAEMETEASGKLGMALIDLETGSTQKAETRLTAIKDEYSGYEAGERARVILGQIYFQKGLIQNARIEFESYSGTDPLYLSTAYAGLALCYEQEKNYMTAAENYEKAAEADERTEVSIDYAVAAAINYELANQPEQARSIYEELLAEHDTFTKKALVEQKLAML